MHRMNEEDETGSKCDHLVFPENKASQEEQEYNHRKKLIGHIHEMADEGNIIQRLILRAASEKLLLHCECDQRQRTVRSAGELLRGAHLPVEAVVRIRAHDLWNAAKTLLHIIVILHHDAVIERI